MLISKRNPAISSVSRRSLLKVGAAAAVVGSSQGLMSRAFAAGYPERNIDVIVPTAEGGGADRNMRSFNAIWKKYLDTNFEPGFYPGASGRVGYEVYMGKYEPDCYSLIFGNMGPEVLNWVVKEPSFNIDDYIYWGRVDVDPGCLFVGAESKLQTLDDIIAEGKKRKLNVGTSRLAHPASIGMLALAEQTGIEVTLIPLSGGKKTIAGAVTGEVDFSVLTSGSVAAAGDAVTTLLVFDDENVLGEALDNAPTMNQVYGTNLPPMLSSRAYGIHKAAADKYPDRFEMLQTSFRKVFDDPEYKETVLKAKGHWEYVKYGGVEECGKFKQAMLELGSKYKDYLTGS
jgi:tripartite-type tricarboxylate transporter receptor subunit TctC